MPSLKETFLRTDTDPFGTYVAFNQVKQLFYYNDIKAKNTGFEKLLYENEDSTSLVINISKNFYLTEKDLTLALAYVNKGNSMFISSEVIDSSFLNTIGLRLRKETAGSDDFYGSMRQTMVSLRAAYFSGDSSFSYYYLPLANYLDVVEAESFKVLGYNERGDPDFIVVFYGKGRFFVHCEPRAFSNYFLLQQDNFQYLQHAFSLVRAVPEHVTWMDFYAKRNSPPGDRDRSSLSVLLKYPAMAWAFWLSFALLLLYLLFGGKRRQRIVKQVPPNENTSIAFTETVSRLYLQKKDNRNMADKMISYLYEHIRNQYFLNTSQVNEAFISVLSRKSNHPLEQTTKLFTLISTLQQQDAVSDQQLLLLNQQIENFYKQKQ